MVLHFRPLGTFLVFTKKIKFCQYFYIYFWEWGNSQNFPFFPLNERNQMNFRLSNWSDITTPPFVKHFLAPQNEFGTQKILDQFTKVLGIGKTPPPCWEKFPNNPVTFFWGVRKLNFVCLNLWQQYTCKQLCVSQATITLKPNLLSNRAGGDGYTRGVNKNDPDLKLK